MALVMGIYDKIIFSVSSLFSAETKKQNSVVFLGCLIAGAGAAFFFLSQGMSRLLSFFPLEMYAFFTGLILASFPRLFKQTGIQSKTQSTVSFLLIGIVALGFFVLLKSLPGDLRLSEGSFFLFLASGFLGLFSSVLPGLSGSTVLLLMGTYHLSLKALTEGALIPLTALSAGGLLGFFCAFYFVRLFLEKRKKLFFCLILGLITGSLPEIIPWEQNVDTASQAGKTLVFLFLGMAVLPLTEKGFFLKAGRRSKV